MPPICLMTGSSSAYPAHTRPNIVTNRFLQFHLLDILRAHVHLVAHIALQPTGRLSALPRANGRAGPNARRLVLSHFRAHFGGVARRVSIRDWHHDGGGHRLRALCQVAMANLLSKYDIFALVHASLIIGNTN